jgi:hypothetical protein
MEKSYSELKKEFSSNLVKRYNWLDEAINNPLENPMVIEIYNMEMDDIIKLQKQLKKI